MIFNGSFTYKHNPNTFGNQPVAVIANFNTVGRFIPIYFRYVANDSSESTYKIDYIKYTKDKHDCFLFCCVVTNREIRHQLILTFYFKDCIWMLEG
jgi:hypothetical protein